MEAPVGLVKEEQAGLLEERLLRPSGLGKTDPAEAVMATGRGLCCGFFHVNAN
jgi:hypothetical protein